MKTGKKILIGITGAAILVAGIVCRQEFFLMIPLFISLFVMGFQSEANRVGALCGAVNSLIYTGAYIYMGVYASAASALLIFIWVCMLPPHRPCFSAFPYSL